MCIRDRALVVQSRWQSQVASVPAQLGHSTRSVRGRILPTTADRRPSPRPRPKLPAPRRESRDW
eukprot:9348784-Prorocentrum_lima.AAC.1